MEWWENLQSRFSDMEETIQRSFTDEEIQLLADWCRRMGLVEVKKWIEQNRENTALILVDMSQDGLAIFNSDPHLHDPAPCIWKYAAMLHCLAAMQSIEFFAMISDEKIKYLNWLDSLRSSGCAPDETLHGVCNFELPSTHAPTTESDSASGKELDWEGTPVVEAADFGKAYLSFQQKDCMRYWPDDWPNNPFEEWL